MTEMESAQKSEVEASAGAERSKHEEQALCVTPEIDEGVAVCRLRT